MRFLKNPLHDYPNPPTKRKRSDPRSSSSPASSRTLLIPLTTDQLPLRYRILKRSFDVIVSSLILILILSWLLPLLAIINGLMGNFPAFFIQNRVGIDNRQFKCYKLRTMPQDRPRVISKWSEILRRHKLDELPQFINVLKGEMSIVGPRPHMLSDHEVFSQAVGRQYFDRHLVLPGITGLAQVEGFEGPVQSMEDLNGRIRCDLIYINRWSLWLDIKIVSRTLLLMSKGLMKNAR